MIFDQCRALYRKRYKVGP